MHGLASEMQNAWQVFLLYLIPVGGGIPAGLMLAQAKGIIWPESTVLYFFSDIVQALIFETVVVIFLFGARFSIFLHKLVAHMRLSTQMTIAKYGLTPGPFALIMIAFGVDPITGRTAAFTAGHGFFTGWMLAIAGDMIFFSVIMVSTYALNGILGDGTWTAVIITACMLLGPWLFRKIKAARV